jgi:hypothetical protein
MFQKINVLVCVLVIGIVVSLSIGVPAFAQTKEATQKIVTKNDYSQTSNWLCRPGRQDACVYLSHRIDRPDTEQRYDCWTGRTKSG